MAPTHDSRRGVSAPPKSAPPRRTPHPHPNGYGNLPVPQYGTNSPATLPGEHHPHKIARHGGLCPKAANHSSGRFPGLATWPPTGLSFAPAFHFETMTNTHPPDGRRTAKLFATILIAGLNTSTLSAGRLVLPMIALGMGASTLLVGVMSSLFSALPMVLSIRFGRWVDRAGTLIPAVFSGALIVIASLIFLMLPSRFSLLAVAGLIGTGAVFCHVATARAVGGHGDISERARNIGYLAVSYSLFQFIGPIVVGLSYEHLGATNALLTIGGFAALSLIGIALPFHLYRRESHQAQDASPTGSAVELLRIKPLRKWLVTSSVFSTAHTLYPFIIALHALNIGLTATQAGILLGALALGTVVSRASVSLVTRCLPAKIILTTALLLGAAIYAALPLVHDMHYLIVLSGLLGLPLGIGVPISLALIYGAAPSTRLNESVGLNMSITNFLQTATPLTSGMLASGLGVGPMIWGLSLVMLATAMLGGDKSEE